MKVFLTKLEGGDVGRLGNYAPSTCLYCGRSDSGSHLYIVERDSNHYDYTTRVAGLRDKILKTIKRDGQELEICCKACDDCTLAMGGNIDDNVFEDLNVEEMKK